MWWDSDENAFQRFIYKPLKMTAVLEPGDRLALRLEKSGWMQTVDDLLPDHNHLMHMYLIRLPEMERVWHLHPETSGAGNFTQNLPALSAGRYQIYADIVHGSELSDGYRMIWDRPREPLSPGRLTSFQFRVEDSGGKPATDMELYMGMQGHAAFVRTDGTVFAHIHPSGTVPMAALALARTDPHMNHSMENSSLPAMVAFPYALPKPGPYRMIVQIKRAGRVETAIFDLIH
jgi:hypothetical protein